MSADDKTLESTKRYYRIDRREIAYLRFILEAYDGLAVLTTLDSNTGLVVLHIAPGCEQEVETILQDLRRSITLESAHPQLEHS